MRETNTVLAEFEITDGSGFLSIVNVDKYKSFVDRDWELDQLMDHFISEMNNDSIIIWATGAQGRWNVVFLNNRSEMEAFREFYKEISVTNSRLYLTNYEDLTMAAQFDDEVIPSKHNSNLFLTLQNGNYNLTIRQIFDPDDYDQFESIDIHFEIIVASSNNRSIDRVDEIYWWTN